MEFTVKQIAELLGVTKPTVQKAIKALSIKPERTQNNNRGYYSYADTVAVIKSVKSDFDFTTLAEFGEKPQSITEKPQTKAPNDNDATENPQNETPNEGEKTEKPPTDETVALLRNMLGVIQEQLAEKDKQLAIKDKQIQDLSDRLAEAMQLTRGQQYIAAADKTTGLLEASNKQGQPEEVIETSETVGEGPVPLPSQTTPIENQTTAADEQPPQKKSFWRRLFGR